MSISPSTTSLNFPLYNPHTKELLVHYREIRATWIALLHRNQYTTLELKLKTALSHLPSGDDSTLAKRIDCYVLLVKVLKEQGKLNAVVLNANKGLALLKQLRPSVHDELVVGWCKNIQNYLVTGISIAKGTSELKHLQLLVRGVERRASEPSPDLLLLEKQAHKALLYYKNAPHLKRTLSPTDGLCLRWKLHYYQSQSAFAQEKYLSAQRCANAGLLFFKCVPVSVAAKFEPQRLKLTLLLIDAVAQQPYKFGHISYIAKDALSWAVSPEAKSTLSRIAEHPNAFGALLQLANQPSNSKDVAS